MIALEDRPLTPREKDVLCLIVSGYSDVQISARLEITVHTVNAYRKKLLRKLKANNVASLVRIAIQRNLVQL